jgi:hypothetical protein
MGSSGCPSVSISLFVLSPIRFQATRSPSFLSLPSTFVRMSIRSLSCLCVCDPLHLFAFYEVSDVSNENRRLLPPRTSCHLKRRFGEWTLVSVLK